MIFKLILTFGESSPSVGVNTFFKIGEISPPKGLNSGQQALS